MRQQCNKSITQSVIIKWANIYKGAWNKLIPKHNGNLNSYIDRINYFLSKRFLKIRGNIPFIQSIRLNFIKLKLLRS